MMRKAIKLVLTGLVVTAMLAMPYSNRGIAYGESFVWERDDGSPWCGTSCCMGGTDCCPKMGCCCPDT